MTPEDMQAYAKAVAEGGPVKKADVIAFMKAYIAQSTEQDPDLQAGGPALTPAQTVSLLPTLPFEVERTGSGIHLPREANRAYTKLEAAALVAAIADATRP